MPSRELNTSFCTLDELRPVIQEQNEINNQFFATIEAGGVIDTYKVAVDLANIGTPNYLNDQMLYVPSDGDLGTYPNAAIPVVADVSSAKERLRADLTQVSGFNDVDDLLLTVTGGVLSFATAVGITDTFKVKCSSGDLTESFLHDALHLNATYVGGADILVGATTEGSGGTDQKERLFVDVSAISGYSGTGTFLLGLVDNVSTYIAAGDIVSSGVAAGYAIDTSGATVIFDPTEITDFSSGAFQWFIHLPGASANTHPKWATVGNYDATKSRYLTSTTAGEFTWSNGPGDGASGTFVCTLSGSISAGSLTNMGQSTGTVYSIAQGSALTSEGSRTIFNPFKISLPASSGGDTIQYTCARTYLHDPDEETESDDQFTITGIDPLHLLASLEGFGSTKALYTDGSAVTDIQWGGAECE